MALLEVRDVSKVFGQGASANTALDRFSFRIVEEEPSVTAVVGESGSGKTTLARLLLGFLEPNEGAVMYRGKALPSLSREERRTFRRDVQAIFQDPFAVYNPFYRVDHLFNMAIRNFRLATSRSEAREMIERAVSSVGLKPGEVMGRYPHQLSGGQRQRLTIARVLLLRPKVLVADEPVSMVDASLRATILQNLLDLHRTLGISLLYITHDLATAYEISDSIIVLYGGSVAESGRTKEIIDQPRHPYTQLLIDSIPLPDPDQPWKEFSAPREEEETGSRAPETGCKFAGRCPHVIPMCTEAPPPLYHSDNRLVTCYLYRDAPVIPPEKAMSVLGRSS